MEEQKTYDMTVRQTPELSMEIIKKYICPAATDQEAYMFLQLCKAQGLNPFLKEAYLVKFGTQAATIITGKDTFTKRADRLPQYDGFKAGIIVLSNGAIGHREGSFVVNGEELLGGWAEVFRKDRSQSFRNEVSLKEYARTKADGSLMSNWKSMPATMIRKVALVQSLREAFPDEFGGMYSPEEMPVDTSALPTYQTGEAPLYPAPVKTETKKPPIQQPKEKTEASEAGKTEGADEVKNISEAQRKRFYVIYKKSGKTDETAKAYLKTKYGIEHSKDIPKAVYETICAWAEATEQPEEGDQIDCPKLKIKIGKLACEKCNVADNCEPYQTFLDSQR